MSAIFTQDYFSFFEQLISHNERAWFQANKPFYESAVADQLTAFIQAMAPHLAEISPHIVADPRRNGGSMFRIYRDTRFSKDKTPYKTHGAVQFRHALGKDVHAPGFYFHASPSECVIGSGIWRPAGEDLKKIRGFIAEYPKKWAVARDDAGFRAEFTLHGESLKRPPRDFPADHPMVEDLKRKDFVAMKSFTPPEVTAPGFVEEVARAYAAASPFMAFLCKALGVPF